MKETTLRILIADDHEVVCAGVRALIEAQQGWEVCGLANNGRLAVERATELKPDIVLLDMTMPELGGVEAVRQIKRVSPKSEILVFSANLSESVVEEVFEAGAKSYIQKGDDCRELISAIRSLAQHKPFFTPEVSKIVFRRFLQADTNEKKPAERAKLTSSEVGIMRLLADGQSNKDVAGKLGISVRTVETHRATVMRKLGLDSLAALVRYAVRNNIIEA